MITSLSTVRLSESVLAVPPLARKGDYSLAEAENVKIIRHIEAGGIGTLLYGGNANFYHLPPGEFEQTIAFLGQSAAAPTLVIPSVGPAYGLMMDQAKALRRTRFPTAMVLPQQGITNADGVETGIRNFVNAAGIPALLYIKNDGYIEPENVKRLADAKLISGIKYATVRENPADDSYLRRLVELVDPSIVISGIGEQPAIIHVRDFGLSGFTSGCICVAPGLSRRMLMAIRKKDWTEAQRIQGIFRPLEDLRNAINPIRVLHEAVRLAGIAETGPLLPLMSNLPEAHFQKVAAAARDLLAAESGNSKTS